MLVYYRNQGLILINMSEKFTEFGLTKDSYAAFDAVSLKELIKDRLSEKNVFTDHVFEGSNISSIIDIIAYSYHTLLFYLNRTSSESIFTESQLYENINRIVKLLNYNPTGYKTSVLTFQAKGQMPPGSYTIPRYSFVDVGGIKFSTNSDISFRKNLSSDEDITSVGENNLLYQGTFEQHPTQTSTGEDFEVFTLNVDSSIKIDAYNIHVFVNEFLEDGTTKWFEYTPVESLFLSTPVDRHFEKRLNENMHYEIRFGNNIYSRRIVEGEQVAIYYLKSDQSDGVIGARSLNGVLSPLGTNDFLQIREDIKSQNTTYMSINDIQLLTLTNSDASTQPESEETVEHIRNYAPRFFSMQNRLVTTNDFKNYIDKQFGNLLTDTKVVNNNEYIDGHLEYVVEKLKIDNPLTESRVEYNQVLFSTSTNFNNVYIYAVPRFEKISTTTQMVNFLTPAQKSLITNNINNIKLLTCDPIIVDPVYIAIDIGAALSTEPLNTSILPVSYLNIVKSRDSQRDDDSIRIEVVNVIKKYFGTASRLGYTIDMANINSEINNINGVVDMYMTRSDSPTLRVQGLTLLAWNPVYTDKDVSIISQNTKLDYFKYPYLFSPSTLANKINVTTSITPV